MALIPRLDIAALDAQPVDPLTKGLPFNAPAMRLGDVGAQDWNVLEGDVPMPVAVIRQTRVESNSAWMSAFTQGNGLVIAPHGKTTMAPYLFDLQIADGAWAITVATVQQMQVCRRFGVRRVLMANQPIGRQAVDACFAALVDEGFELYCLVDGEEGLAQLADGAGRVRPRAGNPLRVLVEVGFPGGRTGARSPETALTLAQKISVTDGLALAGFECFEGLLSTPEAVDTLLDEVAAIARLSINDGLLPKGDAVIVSAGGSAFFDRVGERFNAHEFPAPVLRVLRSGCYLTHDCMGYAAAFERICRETRLVLPPGGLVPALEVWAQVQSVPEPRRALLSMGKRDVGFDAGLPIPQYWYRTGAGMAGPQPIPPGYRTAALNDQHCHLELPAGSDLRVGDLVGFGIGHPCTTFDRWSLLLAVDETYRVIKAVKTFF
jgi:D-serine dehydratase